MVFLLEAIQLWVKLNFRKYVVITDESVLYKINKLALIAEALPPCLLLGSVATNWILK